MPRLGDPGTKLNRLGGDMKRSVVRCTAILSALSLMALGQPNSVSQTSDSVLLGEHIESMKNRKESNEKAVQIRFNTRLFDYHFSEYPQTTQEKIIDKNSTILTQNVGLISEEDFLLLCCLVAAEAENQPFEGKRAVVAVVLNRVDYGDPFEESIKEVIFQEGQFSCVSDGRFFDADSYVTEEDMDAVTAELSERSDPEILYFTAQKYGEYGTPAYSIGDHYFCKE